MKRPFLVILAVLGVFCAMGQSYLLPSIGRADLPPDDEPICPIPWYLGEFEDSGQPAGAGAADFTIFSVDGVPFSLRDELRKGKPVLLVAGNYTCPVFRKQLPTLNQVISTYGSALNTLIYYNVEAHPTDTSPYFGYVNVTSANVNQGILYEQPRTYGERKAIVRDMLNDPDLTINAPVYLDHPCNDLWQFYGPAPNNAYLIDTNGRIFSRHAWFDKFPQDIFCDIDSLLGTTGNCVPAGSSGTFSLEMLSEERVYGPAGTTLSVDLELVNNSATGVQVMLKRTRNVLAPGWASSLCADICYTTGTDSTTIYIEPGERQPFHFYFYTDGEPDTSVASVRFRNIDRSGNVFNRDFVGITTSANGISAMGPIPGISLSPNPASSWIEVKGQHGDGYFVITDLIGKVVHTSQERVINIDGILPGSYFLQYHDMAGRTQVVKFIKM